jgi:hypothetical protein
MAIFRKLFYHWFGCEHDKCLVASNPVSGSQHQRGVHTESEEPPEEVACPGCGKPMKHYGTQLASEGALLSDQASYAVKKKA